MWDSKLYKALKVFKRSWTLPCFLLLFLFLLTCEVEKTIKYPGNGISCIAKDKPIIALHDEITVYAKNIPNAKVENGKIVFYGVNNFNFESSKPLEGKKYWTHKGEEFWIDIEILIESGECVIEIGDLSISISSETVTINNGGKKIYTLSSDFQNAKEVYQLDNVHLRELHIESSTTGEQGLTLYDEKTCIDLINTSITTPAKIRIKAKNGCRGYVGPWMWVRGLE